MTLKEIEKVMDEADKMVYTFLDADKLDFDLRNDTVKHYAKDLIIAYQGVQPEDMPVFYFYKFNSETGKMDLLAKVDRIDRERGRKVVKKKKLYDMTETELEQVKDRFCKEQVSCNGCAFSDRRDFSCLIDFNHWRRLVEANKDKEFFIIEVEDE